MVKEHLSNFLFGKILYLFILSIILMNCSDSISIEKADHLILYSWNANEIFTVFENDKEDQEVERQYLLEFFEDNCGLRTDSNSSESIIFKWAYEDDEVDRLLISEDFQTESGLSLGFVNNTFNVEKFNEDKVVISNYRLDTIGENFIEKRKVIELTKID